jgi:hypothetical protein
LQCSDFNVFLGELSTNANKELAIEIALNELEERWATIELEIGPYKEEYLKMLSVEDISKFLEGACKLPLSLDCRPYLYFLRSLRSFQTTLLHYRQ